VELWLSEIDAGRYETAWDIIAERYSRLILATIRRLVRDEDDVMDVFSDVCQALSEKELARIRRFVDEPRRARFSTWLVAVVRNMTIDWLRKREAPRRPALGLINDVAVPAIDAAAEADTARRLADALAGFPPAHRLALELFVIEGMPAGQVAHTVGWPNAKAVYNNVYRMLDALRVRLERAGIGSEDIS